VRRAKGLRRVVSSKELVASQGEKKLEYFKERIAAWFKENRRDFAWRHTTDAYRLLIAEIMLRRTRAAQVGPVYEAFIERFPSPAALQTAPEAAVLETVRPLGLTWRVPAFKLVADRLVSQYGGTVPQGRDDLMSLPGVGNYVADAVRCFAYGASVAVIDTNTVRVAARYLGFPAGPDSRRKRSVIDSVGKLLDRENPARSNMALLDFAATICRANAPQCTICPVRKRCSWFRSSADPK
jgi:A/G-specific adenine glycosylase